MTCRFVVRHSQTDRQTDDRGERREKEQRSQRREETVLLDLNARLTPDTRWSPIIILNVKRLLTAYRTIDDGGDGGGSVETNMEHYKPHGAHQQQPKREFAVVRSRGYR